MSVHSLQIERHCLGGLLKNQEVFSDVAAWVSEHDFYNDVHQTIYCVLRDFLIKGEDVDKTILAARIKNYGIGFKDDINIFDYIATIAFTEVTAKGTLDSFQELVKLRICREIHETGAKLQAHAKGNINNKIDDIITEADAIYNGKISAYELSDEPVNLFEKMEELIEGRGNNPIDDVGFLTPYPTFNRLYGGWRPKNIYAIVSRPGEGKSTWLYDAAFKTAKAHDFKIKVLYLDTENQTEDMQFRAMSSETNVPTWYLETGNWRKNEEFTNRVRSVLPNTKHFECFHFRVGNKTVDQICSIIRRWYLSKVGRGGKGIIVYDYIKLTGERLGESWKEYQAIGDKVDKFKRLSEEVACPFLTAMQLNRSGENTNKLSSTIIDDASAISLSDRLQWFASFVAICRRKSVDEIALDTPAFGTHKLINLKTRFQGRDARGHIDLLKRMTADGTEKYVKNYLNFQIENFNVQEKGSLADIIEASKQGLHAHDHNPLPQGDGTILL